LDTLSPHVQQPHNLDRPETLSLFCFSVFSFRLHLPTFHMKTDPNKGTPRLSPRLNQPDTYLVPSIPTLAGPAAIPLVTRITLPIEVNQKGEIIDPALKLEAINHKYSALFRARKRIPIRYRTTIRSTRVYSRKTAQRLPKPQEIWHPPTPPLPNRQDDSESVTSSVYSVNTVTSRAKKVTSPAYSVHSSDQSYNPTEIPYFQDFVATALTVPEFIDTEYRDQLEISAAIKQWKDV
jgi:hypothetical protein